MCREYMTVEINARNPTEIRTPRTWMATAKPLPKDYDLTWLKIAIIDRLRFADLSFRC